MPVRRLRWLAAGLLASGGAGLLALAAVVNSAFAYADDIGLVIGASGVPIPGSDYVRAADTLYLDNPQTQFYPDLTFYQATSSNPYGAGLFTPEGLYPLTGVKVLPFDYPLDTAGFPDQSTSVGQGMTILENTIAADTAAGNTSTVFGYSQSSTISSLVMQQLDPSGTPHPDSGLHFLLVGDPSAPNGGLLERFAGFETTTGHTTSLPFNAASLGVSFDGATPADDFPTSIYTLEYDGFADFPRYPIDFLSDLNALLGIAEIHGTYLNGGVDGSGPTAEQIATATLLPGSQNLGYDTLTNYYMIDETPPLVSLLPKPLQDLLGPDLTYLINLGYGDGALGYSVTDASPANIPTPFGLFPDVSLHSIVSTLAADTELGFKAFEADLAHPAAWLPSTTSSSLPSMTDLMTALSADVSHPTATLTDLVNAFSSAASSAYATLLPTADFVNALTTSLPAYDLSLFTDNLTNGNLLDALGLPIAANTALETMVTTFEYQVLSSALSAIGADFSGLL